MDDGDGVGRWGPSLYYLATALGVVAGGLGFLLMSPSPPTTLHAVVGTASSSLPLPVAAGGSAPSTPLHVSTATRTPTAVTPPSAMAAAPGAPASEPEVDSDPTPDLSTYVNPGEVPTMEEVIERLKAAGVTGGLAAFPPPGTKPPLVGLAVPDDFVLPEGYVRHYQATDDGQRIEPVLMFSPDHPYQDPRWRDSVPQDRLVPQELAPPGLPIRRIEIPLPTAGRPGR
jgi:hypothetical protein